MGRKFLDDEAFLFYLTLSCIVWKGIPIVQTESIAFGPKSKKERKKSLVLCGSLALVKAILLTWSFSLLLDITT